MESTIILAAIAQEFRIELVPNQPIEIDPRFTFRLKPELQEEQGKAVRNNVLCILQERIQSNLFQIDHLEQDLEVFLYSIGYFFPMPTTEKYYEPEENKLCIVIDWFIQKWQSK